MIAIITIKNNAHKIVVTVIAVLFLFIKKSPLKASFANKEDFILYHETPTARMSFARLYKNKNVKTSATIMARKVIIPAGVLKNIIT